MRMRKAPSTLASAMTVSTAIPQLIYSIVAVMVDLTDQVEAMRLSSSGPRVKPPLVVDNRPKLLRSIQELYSPEIRLALAEEIAHRERSRVESNRQVRLNMQAMLADPKFVPGIDQLPEVNNFNNLTNVQ
jgi:hypothetical protein